VGAAAARAALEHVLIEEAYERTIALGERLADGLERTISGVDLPWTVQRLGTRAAYTTAPVVPRDAAEARAADIAGFKDAQRVHGEPRRLGFRLVGRTVPVGGAHRR
jgi:glutamate-1-semialdehyde aminotransferase